MAIISKINRIDLKVPFDNCPYLHKLFIHYARTDVKSERLTNFMQVSVQFCERLRYLHFKQSGAKVILEPHYMLGSKFRYFRINSDQHFQWQEKDKLPKPVIYIDIKNVYVDRNFVENFEW